MQVFSLMGSSWRGVFFVGLIELFCELILWSGEGMWGEDVRQSMCECVQR